MPTSTVVIPCYNEASRLDAAAFEAFACAHHDIHFLFVNDGSTDGTGEVLRDIEQRNPQQMSALSLPRNMGKAEAVRHGLLAACAQRPRYVAFWDADLATPLDEIPNFIELLERRPHIEMVFGSRVNLLGRSVRRNLMRHYVGRVFATAAAAALGLGIYDTQCGAKMFRVSDAFIQRLRQPFISNWIFDVEMIAREIQARRGTNQPQVREIIYEHPLMVWRDVKGSKLKSHDFFIVARDLARIYLRYRQPAAPAAAHTDHLPQAPASAPSR